MYIYTHTHTHRDQEHAECTEALYNINMQNPRIAEQEKRLGESHADVLDRMRPRNPMVSLLVRLNTPGEVPGFVHATTLLRSLQRMDPSTISIRPFLLSRPRVYSYIDLNSTNPLAQKVINLLKAFAFEPSNGDRLIQVGSRSEITFLRETVHIFVCCPALKVADMNPFGYLTPRPSGTPGRPQYYESKPFPMLDTLAVSPYPEDDDEFLEMGKYMCIEHPKPRPVLCLDTIDQ
jgi:hypothetical protein